MNGSGDDMDTHDVIRVPTGPGVAQGGQLTIREATTDVEEVRREAVFQVERLSVFYGSFRAIRDVTLAIGEREITALIGPSGCGKTTFLRCLNRMNDLVEDARVEGQVLYHGVDLYDPQVDPVEVRRRVGMVFQKPNPFPAMSIYDNVLAGLKLTAVRASRRTRDDLVEECLRKAGLWHEVQTRLRSPGGALSGGQQQRLCIARALAVEPEVLLMDEPCSALDPISTLAIEDLIARLKDDYTIVIVTHNMQQAARVSDTTAFFNVDGPGRPGRLVETGATEQIFRAPAQRKTEDYITGRFG